MKRIIKFGAIAMLVLMVAGISVFMFVPGIRSDSTPDCVPTADPTDIDTFPYHPLVYELDLSILAYQLYSQSLVFPVDPYYEEQTDRDAFIEQVRDWATDSQGPAQLADPGSIGVRGPGVLAGFDDNVSHDPILYDYGRIHPWSDNVVNVEERWTEYLTPNEITGQIRDVYVAYRPIGGSETDVVIDQIEPGRIDADPDATDILIAFEGGTGDKGEADQPHSQSLMGFVLARSRGVDAGYDVHVTFRGSRSGSASRALFQALSTENAKGNPDWITDLGWRLIGADDGIGDIAATGKVHRGFATSTQANLPTLMASLDRLAGLMNDDPTSIYVTGHSLGGGLAQHFTSAMLLGDQYGPDGGGSAMPSSLTNWPWTEIKLVTFGAPRAGDEDWAREMTIESLESEFYDDGLVPFDNDALDASAEEIVPRLVDSTRPAAYRVLISTDPITNDVFDDAKGVGKTVYVNLVCGNGAWGLPDFLAHEPFKIRDFIVLATADRRTPKKAWQYPEMDILNPDRDGDAMGSAAEYEKLKDAIIGYYERNDLWFDVDAFERDFALMMSLG